MTPDQINEQHGQIFYRCRNCRAATGLSWWGGTSCPVCSRQECIEAVRREYHEAFDEMMREME